MDDGAGDRTADTPGSRGGGPVACPVGFDPAAWLPAERELLLGWFSAAAGQLNDAELAALASLPLFEREGGAFVPLRGVGRPRTVPPDLPGIDLLVPDAASSGRAGGGGDHMVVFLRKPEFEAVRGAGLNHTSTQRLLACLSHFPLVYRHAGTA